MIKLTLVGAVLAAMVVALVIAAPGGGSQAEANDRNFVANLSGGEEVPPVETRGRGQAVIRLSNDGTALQFKLIVAQLGNIVAAHIHCAPAGVNGPVGVTLFSGSPTTTNGILAHDTVTAPNPANACGWSDLSAVGAAMSSGNTYVNVHTLQNLAGEVRGQIR